MYNINDSRKIINGEIDKLNLDREPASLYDSIRYMLSIGGKRLRPALMIMACNLFREDVSDAIGPALGIEIFHNFTLLHDDIMDRSSMRRNQQTVHGKWGMNTAILSGDAMSIMACRYVCKCRKDVLCKLMGVFNETALEVCEGQQLDMDFERITKVNMEDYLLMIGLKTAVLLACSMKMGAWIGEARDEDAEQLYRFGKNLGMAFQLQDDLLDVYGRESSLGKKIGLDIVANKKTFLMIRAMEKADKRMKQALETWIRQNNAPAEEKIRAVKKIYDLLEIRQETIERIHNYNQKALECLEHVNVPANRKVPLRDFARSMLDRKS